MAADPELLRDIPLFQTLDDSERTAVAALMQEARFAAGTTLFREHDPGGVMFAIQRGRVELWVTDEDRSKVIVEVLEPGDFFGELSLLDGGLRSTAATALDDVECFALARDGFMDLVRRRTDLGLELMGALARRIRKTDELLRKRVRNPNEVLEERETFGERVADGVARFGGSWRFIMLFGGFLFVWILLNTVFMFARQADGQPFDPYPFILLNLMLSMVAALQAPVIMMSQNRTDAKDRVRSELDYQVNVKAEFGIQRLHDRMDALEHKLEQQLEDRPQAKRRDN